LEIYTISAENAGWLQGSGTGSSYEVGAAAWKSLATGTGASDTASNRVEWDGGVGLGDPGDGYGTTYVATFTAIDEVTGYYTIELPVSIVASWISDPSSNAGLLLRVSDEETSGNVAVMFSSDDDTTAYHPSLSVTVIPEQSSSALLLGGAGLVLILRQRFNLKRG
jgi:hypothetical protein